MKEIRNLPLAAVELRDSKAFGIAAPFNADSHDLGGFIERIAPGAFKRSLEAAEAGGVNIYALWAHDNSQPLASTRSGKLKLIEGDDGLEFEMDITRMSEAQRSALEDGDLQKSFGFITRKDAWEKRDDGTIIRTLIDVDLTEISYVINPAYPDTAAAVRSLDAWRQEEEEVETVSIPNFASERNELHKRAMLAAIVARGRV